MDSLKRKRQDSDRSPDDHSETRAAQRPRTVTGEKTFGSESDRLPALHDIKENANVLATLLDFSSLVTSEEISARFDQVGHALLCDFHLVVARGDTETEFEILELEFYLRKSGCHEDPFTHGSEEQRNSGRWYFHRAPRRSEGGSKTPTAAGGYRGGTRKGLDLTLGGPMTSPHFSTPNTSSQALRGGALLRTLRRISDSKVISGPSLLVDEVLRLSGASTIVELVAGHWKGDITAFPRPPNAAPRTASLYLKSRSRTSAKGPELQIYKSPRIGLDLSHASISLSSALSHPRVIYVPKPYRYFTHPHLLTANGRGQTFFGVYEACMASNRYTSDARLCQAVAQITGIKEATVGKYLTDFRQGLASGTLKSFVGAVGKGASASPSSFLKMMGTLQRVRGEDDARLSTNN